MSTTDLQSAELGEQVRVDFPVLSQKMNGKPLIYLDSGATSLKPQAVIDSEIAYLTTLGATIHRGVYEFSQRATTQYDETREKLADFINAAESAEVIFTKSATEASNIIARSWGETYLRPGDEIVTTEVEHHANIIPWQEVSRRTGAVLRFVPIGPAGEIELEAVKSVLSDRTRLVAVTGMSNVTGYMPDLAAIAAAAHEVGALVVADGAQLVSHHAVDVQALDLDFLTFSGHKMCGPTGVGVLYGKRAHLEAMEPFLYGGDMIVRVKRDIATYKPIPDKFEPGTPNISGVIALGAAIDYLQGIGMEAIAAHEADLVEYALSRLAEIPEVTVYGPTDVRRGGLISFNLGDIHPHDVGTVFDQEGIAVRAGFHCAQPFMRYLGIHGTVRASFYIYNTRSDIDALVTALGRVKEIFA
jgi:cysteine desulfurase / selenocysteine lyase